MGPPPVKWEGTTTPTSVPTRRSRRLAGTSDCSSILFIILIQRSEKRCQGADILAGQLDAGEFPVTVSQACRALEIR